MTRRVLDARGRGESSMGRVPPLMVVGEGAAKFAREVVWLESLERWLRLGKEMSGAFRRRGGSKRNGRCCKGTLQQQQLLQRHVAAAIAAASIEVAEPGAGVGVDSLHARQDTVGAVMLLDDAGDIQVSAGVSSEGLVLKSSGRVGDVGFYGFCRLSANRTETHLKVVGST
ncbi:hypothetical protein BGW80DRAFT_685728 [Lactifluus volemus]|nr:hypothetical protein BGW80DRAFT_685728 [Lactifluus volemus]